MATAFDLHLLVRMAVVKVPIGFVARSGSSDLLGTPSLGYGSWIPTRPILRGYFYSLLERNVLRGFVDNIGGRDHADS